MVKTIFLVLYQSYSAICRAIKINLLHDTVYAIQLPQFTLTSYFLKSKEDHHRHYQLQQL